MVQITLKIDGMHCGMCEAHVNDVVRKSANVKKVTSSHVKNQTVILASDDSSLGEIKAGIAAQGYRVLSEEIVPYEKRGLFSKKIH